MKKRVLSAFLTIQFAISMLVCVSAKAEENIYYQTIDLSGNYNSAVYLSQDTAGTYTNDTVKYPDFFVGQLAGTKYIPYALSKESIEAMTSDGIFNQNNVPFELKPSDNQKSACGSACGSIEVPKGYYTYVKVLTVTTPENYGDQNIYSGALSTEVSGEISMRRQQIEELTDSGAEWAKVLPEDDFSTKAKPKLLLEKYKISDNTKIIRAINLWLQPTSSKRILAMTMGQTESEVKAQMERDINAVLSDEAPSREKVENLQKYIDQMEKQGFSTDSIENIDTFKDLKNKFVDVKGYDLSTDFEYNRINITFTAPVSEDSLTDSNFTVLSDNEEQEYIVKPIFEDEKVMGAQILAENKFDYSNDIEVTVSSKIKNALDERFSLGEDYKISFRPKAPSVYIEKVDVDKTEDTAKVSIRLKNNSEEVCGYALTIGSYTKDGEMTDKELIKGEVSEKGEVLLEKTVKIDAESSVECYLFDSFEKMNILNKPIIK